MTDTAIQTLLWAALSIGFLHTIVGVDHYLPFVAIGKARGWSLSKTLLLTFVCGLGHILSSVILGVFGILMGIALGRLTWLESIRGSFAAWLLITFGFIYALCSLFRTLQGKHHTHLPSPLEIPDPTHQATPASRDKEQHQANKLTRWTLFLIFVFGPCEALIPLLMVPAYSHDGWVVFYVAVLFGLATLTTMFLAVSVGYMGLKFFSFRALHHHGDTIAGLAIASSGLAIQFFGL